MRTVATHRLLRPTSKARSEATLKRFEQLGESLRLRRDEVVPIRFGDPRSAEWGNRVAVSASAIGSCLEPHPDDARAKNSASAELPGSGVEMRGPPAEDSVRRSHT